MDLTKLLSNGAKVKIEVSLDDLISFAEFILEKYKEENQVTKTSTNEFGGIELAVDITGYSKSSIYTLVSKREIPFYKKNGKLWFSEKELTDWLLSGNKEEDLRKYIV